MRTRTFAVALLAAAAVASVSCTTGYTEPEPEPGPQAFQPAPVVPEVSAGVGFFYDALAPYGSWVTVATYGEVWVPSVSPWWRPYTEGRWAYTDDGWTWVSEEPWGWATCHYGRWYYEPEYGWAWVPGNVWAPAWVAWRSGGGHIGWAPLPPQARWEEGRGFARWDVDFDAVIAPQSWCFVEVGSFTAPAVRQVVLPAARNVTFIHVTQNITNYTYINNRIVNNGVDVHRIEQATRQPVPRYRIVDRESPAALRSQPTSSNEIPMVRRVVAVRGNTVGQPAGTQWHGASPGAERHTAAGTAPVSQGGATGQPGDGRLQRSFTPQVRGTSTVNVETPEALARRHQIELQELEAHHAERRVRLQQIQQSEKSQAAASAAAEQLRARHLAELRALQEQQQREAQLLARRHERELNAAHDGKTATTSKKPEKPPKHHTDGDKGQS